jgi:TolB-like protein
MRRVIFVHTLMLLSISIASAQLAEKQIAVLDLGAMGINPVESAALTDRLRSELVNTREFRVIEREKMVEILTEQGFQQSGCTSDECAVEIGKLLNIQQICAGSVARVGSLYTLTLRLISVESGQILATVTDDCSCPIEQVLTSSLRILAGKLVEEIKKYPELFVPKGGKGDVYLKSSLTPAHILVDGQAINEQTPTTVKNLSAGEHVLKVVKDDYIGSKIVIVKPDEILDETITMSKTRGGIKVYSNPGEADIYIEDQYYGKTPKIIKDLAAGEYLLSLKKEGFLELKRRIKVTGEEYTEIDERIVKPAAISISSQPAQAVVFIRGQEMGRTTLQLNDLYPEKIYVEVKYPGYKTERKYVQLTEGQSTSEIMVLEKLPALNVTSDPAAAKVYIDELLKGQTPLRINDLSEVRFKVVIKKEYFNDWQQDIVLHSGEDLQQLNAKLTYNEGLLIITTEPASAEGLLVSLGGIAIGKTPLSIKKPYGRYNLEIKDDKYQRVEDQIIVDGPKIERNYKLNFRQGLLKLNGIHQDAELAINGKIIESASSEISVPAGKCNIRLSKQGYQTFSEKIDLLPDQTHNVEITLLPKKEWSACWRSALLPGWGQAYQDKRIRSWLYPLAVAGLATASIFRTADYNNKISDYNQTRAVYTSAFDANDIEQLRRQMDDNYDQLEKAENTRNILYVATGVVWLWNIIDTLILPPGWQLNHTMTSGRNGPVPQICLSFGIP